MSEENWARPYTPPAGGMARLRRKIGEAQERERRETQMITVLATATALAFTAYGFWPQPSIDLTPRLNYADSAMAIEDAQAVRIPNTPPGIRIYWVLR